MDLVRKQTYITPEQDRALKRIAAEEHISEAEAMRRALQSWLSQKRDREQEDPLGAFIGWYHGDPVNDHDDIYR